MKSKIVALSKNEEFKNLLNQKRVSNKYVTIFFGRLINKDKAKLNISFVTKKKIGNAVKKVSLKFDYSYLVIAKPTMLNNNYTFIKETLIRDLERIR